MKELIGKRIKSARKLGLFSLQDVADELGISKQAVGKYESGKSTPNSSTLIELAAFFNLDLDYFFRETKIELGEISFRKKASFGAKKIDAIKERIKFKLEDYIFIEEILNLQRGFETPFKDAKVNNPEDLFRITDMLRDVWEIGFNPIPNIIRLFEEHNIIVIEVSEETKKFDGLHTLVEGKYPIIVINRDFSIERKRFTLMHELAHLLLELDHLNEDKEKEKYCDMFASEMLYSRKMAIKDYGEKRKTISAKEYVITQERYGISVAAVQYKLVEIGILPSSSVKSFHTYLRMNKSYKEYVEKERYPRTENSTRYYSMVERAYSESMISESKYKALLKTNAI